MQSAASANGNKNNTAAAGNSPPQPLPEPKSSDYGAANYNAPSDAQLAQFIATHQPPADRFRQYRYAGHDQRCVRYGIVERQRQHAGRPRRRRVSNPAGMAGLERIGADVEPHELTVTRNRFRTAGCIAIHTDAVY